MIYRVMKKVALVLFLTVKVMMSVKSGSIAQHRDDVLLDVEMGGVKLVDVHLAIPVDRIVKTQLNVIQKNIVILL
jgi:hypothetical protein